MRVDRPASARQRRARDAAVPVGSSGPERHVLASAERVARRRGTSSGVVTDQHRPERRLRGARVGVVEHEQRRRRSAARASRLEIAAPP